MMRYDLLMAAALLAAGGAAPACADETIQTGAPAAARHTSGAIALDGQLNEADWQNAPVLDSFTEYYPGDRTPPHDHTAARFLYDDHYLYVALRADLAEPEQLRTPFVRRDRVNASHDYMQIYIDPLGARRSAYLFRVNARGVKTDGVRDEAGQSETTDPDFDWDVATHIDAGGWTAELRIPLSTLRIERSGAQTWTVVVTRGVPRANNVQMASAPFPHDGTCFLCHASTLAIPDLRPDTEHVIAWLSGSALADHADPGGSDFNLDFSLDLKWLPYAGAAVDLTIRPDFSQVEADSPQLTANERFALSLPEKRAFFREATDLISTPISAIYTRSIAAPDVGLRFTHRSSDFNATAFAAVDGGRPGIIEPGFLGSDLVFPDFDSTVAFARGTESWGGAALGGIYVGKFNGDGSSNNVGGADFSWGDDTNRITAQLLTSQTQNPNRPDLLPAWQGQNLSGQATYLRWDHTGRIVSALQYTRFDDDFRTWLGFTPRVGYQEAFADFRLPFYLTGGGPINDVTPYLDYDYIAGLNTDGQEGGPVVGVAVGARRSSNFDFSFHPSDEVLTQTGEERHVRFLQWTATAIPSRHIPVVQLNGRYGETVDFDTGDVVDGWMLNAILRLRPIDRLELEGRYAVDVLGDGPQHHSRLTDRSVEGLATWYFGPSFYMLADYQVHDTLSHAPLPDQFESSRASLQFVWLPNLAWQSYWGVRSVRTDGSAQASELYLKLTRRLTF